MKNKLKSILALSLFTVLGAFAQSGDVGIGTTSPDASAALDITSTTKGLLIPRMNTADRGNILAPANGLMIFNTDTNQLEFNSGTTVAPSWTAASGSTAWSLTGNAGTSTATNFLGTTDNVPLALRVNNTPMGSLSLKNIFIGENTGGTSITTGERNVAFGDESHSVVTTATQNTSVGHLSMRDVTTGANNVAVGGSALQTNTTGSGNTALGNGSLYITTTGNENTAVGSGSLLYNVAGSVNTGIGTRALLNNNYGNNNTALGHAAGAESSTGILTDVSNSVFIGSGSRALTNTTDNEIVIGATATGLGSNTVVLGNNSIVTTALKGNVGIGTDAPLAPLHVRRGTGAGTLGYSLVTDRDNVVVESNANTPNNMMLISDVFSRYAFSTTDHRLKAYLDYNKTANDLTLINNYNATYAPGVIQLKNIYGSGLFNQLALNGDGSVVINSTKTILNGSSGNVGVGTTAPDDSSVLDVSSTTKGFLPPRMTNAQMQAIVNPADGLMAFNTTLGCMVYFKDGNYNCTHNAPTPRTPAAPLGASFTSHFNGITAGVSVDHTLSTYTTGETFDQNTSCASKDISAQGCGGLTQVTGASGTVYPLVNINGQCWFQTNLNEIPTTFANYTTTSYVPFGGDSGYWGYYNTATPGGTAGWGTTEPAAGEGYLYQWSAAMNNSITERARGACPSGFHVPSDCEWMYLEHGQGMALSQQVLNTIFRSNTADNEGTPGYKLRSEGTGQTNTSGFAGLLPGYRSVNGNFSLRGSNVYWWSSTSSTGVTAFYRNLTAGNRGVFRHNFTKDAAFSVRCLKD